jgi:hypothetical protein
MAQTIWFEPDLAGYFPTAYSYLGSRFTTYEMLLCCLPVAGIAIVIGIWKMQSWAWAMAMAFSLFVLFQAGIYWMFRDFSAISLIQITAILICCIGCFVAARRRILQRKDIIAMSTALIIAIAIVYVKSTFFRSISIDYDQPVPDWFEVWDHSNYVGTKAVFLWWVLYWAIVVTHAAVSAVFRTRSSGYK